MLKLRVTLPMMPNQRSRPHVPTPPRAAIRDTKVQVPSDRISLGSGGLGLRGVLALLRLERGLQGRLGAPEHIRETPKNNCSFSPGGRKHAKTPSERKTEEI